MLSPRDGETVTKGRPGPRRVDRAFVDEQRRRWDVDTHAGYFLPPDRVLDLWERAEVYRQAQYGAPINKVAGQAKLELLGSMVVVAQESRSGVVLFRRATEVVLRVESRDC